MKKSSCQYDMKYVSLSNHRSKQQLLRGNGQRRLRFTEWNDSAPNNTQMAYAAARKSLSGLNNIWVDASADFDELASICDQLLPVGRLSNSMLVLRNIIRVRSRRIVRAYRSNEDASSPIS